jgi:AraC-like DNA-binding protein
MSTDTLSDVLRAVRLTGAVFFSVDASSPWVAEAPPASVIAPHIMPGAEHVIEYHVMVSGSCWGGLVGEPPLRLEAGDVIVFPQGDPHVMSSAPGMRGEPDLALHRRPVGQQLPLLIDPGGGGPERTRLVCGFLGCDARPFNPLLATLPRVLHVRPRDPDDGLIGHFVRFAVSESGERGSGSECVLARLSELMFVEVVRRYVAALPAEQTGWLAGLRDPTVGKALMHLHDRPAADWTIESLAKTSGTSRSILAERFAHFVGIPPMQYLAQWRMQLAAGMLAGGTATLADISEQVGYGSEAALSRAFKKVAGVPPAAWRQGRRAGGSAPATSPTAP